MSAASSSNAQPLVEARQPAAAKRSVLRPHKTLEQVRKALRDNFSSFSHTETHMTLVDGKSLVTRLEEDKRRTRIDPGFKMGGPYYAKMRHLYGSKENAASALHIENENEAVQSAFRKAIAAFKANPPRQDLLEAWCASAVDVNQKEVCALGKVALLVRPSTSASRLRMCLNIMRFWNRLGLATRFVAETAGMSQWFDTVLCQAHMKAKGSLLSSPAWLRANVAVWPLVLPEADVAAVLRERQKWKNVKSNLERVVGSSSLGKRLFGYAAAEIAGEEVNEKLSLAVEALVKKNPVTVALVDAAKSKVLREIEQMADYELVPPRRDVTVAYRGVEIKVEVQGVADFFDQMFAATMKTHLADDGKLPGLNCEHLLVKNKESKGPEYATELFAHIVAASKTMNEQLDALGIKDGSSVQETMQKKMATLMSVDKSWKVEVAFFQSVTGSTGLKLLQEKVLSIMPTAEIAKNIPDTIGELKHIKSSELYLFCPKSAQGYVDACVEMLGRMQCGKPPCLPLDNNDFVIKLRMQLQYFCRAYNSEKKQHVVGKEAAMCHLTSVEQALAAKKKVTMNLLEPVCVFSFLYDDDERKRADQATKEVLAAMGCPAKPKRIAEDGEQCVGPKKKKARKMKDGDEVVDAIFRN